jgi:putative ABC transport system substrate-binding protein
MHFRLLGGAAWPLAARAQEQTKIARIGILGLASVAAVAPYVNAVRAGLRDLGYIERKNLIVEYRLATTIMTAFQFGSPASSSQRRCSCDVCEAMASMCHRSCSRAPTR